MMSHLIDMLECVCLWTSAGALVPLVISVTHSHPRHHQVWIVETGAVEHYVELASPSPVRGLQCFKNHIFVLSENGRHDRFCLPPEGDRGQSVITHDDAYNHHSAAPRHRDVLCTAVWGHSLLASGCRSGHILLWHLR